MKAEDISIFTVQTWARDNNQWGTHQTNAEAMLAKVKEQVAADTRFNGREIYRIEYSQITNNVLIVTFAHGEQANVPAV